MTDFVNAAGVVLVLIVVILVMAMIAYNLFEILSNVLEVIR